MKKLWIGLIAAMAMLIVCGWALADTSGTCGENLTWTLTDEGLLTISGTGEMTDYSYTVGPWENGLQQIVIEDGVTTIGTYAFYNCSSLKSVTLPDSLTSIGKDAFAYCSSLTNVTIPNNVKSIDNEAFYNCKGLTSFTIPDSVTNIGLMVFGGCSDLTSIFVSEGNTEFSSVDGVLFNRDGTTLITCPGGRTGEYTISSNVTSLGHDAFVKCIKLTSITIPRSVTRFDYGVFLGCSGLTSITIPDSLTTINSFTFSQCVNLISITIPNSVKSIGQYAFSKCKSLPSITIPDSVKSIEMYAFYNCSSLTDVYYGGTETQWNAVSIKTYNECLTNANIHFNRPGGPNILALPSDLSAIGAEAFAGLTNVDEIIIPDSVTSIAADAFEGINVTLIVASGSYAETWASDNGIAHRVR